MYVSRWASHGFKRCLQVIIGIGHVLQTSCPLRLFISPLGRERSKGSLMGVAIRYVLIMCLGGWPPYCSINLGGWGESLQWLSRWRPVGTEQLKDKQSEIFALRWDTCGYRLVRVETKVRGVTFRNALFYCSLPIYLCNITIKLVFWLEENKINICQMK